ncbi:MAG TPA: TIM barrel protein [Candidatus Saccharimonadales bacterium]|nr:TIM barrel protein [Candidatus Saccharimonadales bacterium]
MGNNNFKENSKSAQNKRPIGIHIRLMQGLSDVAQTVQRLNVSVAQSFLLTESGKYAQLSHKIVKDFVKQKEHLQFLYFVHAAYWSSLVQVGSKEFLSLCKEAEIAYDLQSDGIVIHVGATRAQLQKNEQVLYVADAVNELLHQVPDIKLLLENSPHAGRNFGGDITDFGLLLQHIEQKDRVQFCIDTAHAFVFGYDLVHKYKRQDFFTLLQSVFDNNQIALLHVNDTPELCGSYIDKHGIPGDGMIGQKSLTWFIAHEMCKNVPIIMELPSSCVQGQDAEILNRVKSWDI